MDLTEEGFQLAKQQKNREETTVGGKDHSVLKQGEKRTKSV